MTNLIYSHYCHPSYSPHLHTHTYTTTTHCFSPAVMFLSSLLHTRSCLEFVLHYSVYLTAWWSEALLFISLGWSWIRERWSTSNLIGIVLETCTKLKDVKDFSRERFKRVNIIWCYLRKSWYKWHQMQYTIKIQIFASNMATSLF